jgi:hypothetical protein
MSIKIAHYSQLFVKLNIDGEERRFIDIKKLIKYLKYYENHGYNILEADGEIKTLIIHKYSEVKDP